ncbi:MAG: YfhO family protein [Lachnospiraceae bacterium]|nr:YfhO family protein [Lachnospiraceae bacterium]
MDEKGTIRMLLIKKNYRHIYAFLFAVLIVVAAYYVVGILPGQQWVNTYSDAYIQEAAFSRLLMRHILDGAGMFYSNEISLGQNTSFVYAMYGYSPLSVLYLLPIKLCDILMVGNILRIGLAAAFFELFLRKGMKIDHFSTVLWAACYALSGFHIYFQQSANFDEGVYLFPLVMWMLFRFVRTGKGIGLCLSYALAFVANFFCGYIIGMGSFVALVLLLIIRDGKQFVRRNTSLLFHYIHLVLTAIAISMLLLLPALAFYMGTMRGEFNGTFYTKDSLQQFLEGCFWGKKCWANTLSAPLYAGVPVLILLGRYFMNHRISRWERGIMGVALCTLLPAYYLEPIYLVLHAFNPPTGFPMRFAYVYVFLMVVLAARQCTFPEDIKQEIAPKKWIIMLALFSIVTGVILFLTQDIDARRIPVNLVLVWIWGCLLFFLGKRGNCKKWIISAGIVLALELAGNTVIALDKGMYRVAYEYADEQITPLVEWIKKEQEDGQLYRARIGLAYSSNIQAERGYNGIGVYSTALYPALQKFLIYMGDNTNGYYHKMEGNTDFMEMLLGIRYRARLNVPDPAFGHETYYREVNDRTLPIGFMSSKQLETMGALGENPFENQNRIASALLGEDAIVYRCAELPVVQSENMLAELTETGGVRFQRQKEQTDGRLAFVIPKHDYEHAYFMLSNVTADHSLSEYKLDDDATRISLYSEKDRLTEGVRGEDYFNPGKGVMELDQEADWFYMLLMSRQNIQTVTEFKHLYMYYQEEETLEQVYNRLAPMGWKVLESDPIHIYAQITSSEEYPVLFLSIPYDPAWHCVVDGQEREVMAVLDGTFSAVELPAGEHDIRLEYAVPGLWGGRACFLLGVISLGIMIWMDYQKEKGKANR